MLVELDSWSGRSQWYQPMLTVEEMASVLGVRTQSVRQYMSSMPGFPRPVETTAGRSRCIQAEFYEFVAAERPHLRHRIPRLYPVGKPHLPSAQFLGSEIRDTARRAKVVLHYWQPGDHRGPIVVAYCSDYVLTPTACELADNLAQLCTGVSAVIVPTETSSLIPDPAHPEFEDPDRHLEIKVAEPSRFEADFDGEIGWLNQFSWSDLANLLRVDVPYWPWGLRDVDAMATWRPGQVFTVPPCVRENMSTAHIWDALNKSCSATVELNDLLIQLCRHTDYQLAKEIDLIPGTSRYRHNNEQGLLRAAVPAIDDAEPKHPTASELARLLHMKADPRYAEIALQSGRLIGLWDPVITGVYELPRDELVPLGQKWRDRLLRDNTSGQSGELGHITLTGALSESDRHEATYWYDPLQPDCWIVQTSTKILVTQSPNIASAHGDLKTVEISGDGEQVFVADNSGTPWLMPAGTNGYYRIGYNGTSPRMLARALEELISDIRGPLSGGATRFVDGREEPAALLNLLITSSVPLTLSRAELEHLIDPLAPAQAPVADDEVLDLMAAPECDKDRPDLPEASACWARPDMVRPIVFTADATGQMVAVDATERVGAARSAPIVFHDFDAKVIDRTHWEQLFDKDIHARADRLIGLWESDDEMVRVTTVWTGVSVAGGEPLIFHTTVAGGLFDGATAHYGSAAQAHVGHARTVTELQEQRVPWFLVLSRELPRA